MIISFQIISYSLLIIAIMWMNKIRKRIVKLLKGISSYNNNKAVKNYNINNNKNSSRILLL